MAQDEVFEKLNDYTLSTYVDFDHQKQADPTLRRIFNFEARQVTTIFSMWYGASVTSALDVKNFSALDSLAEVERMRGKLIALGGHPPALESGDALPGKIARLGPRP